MAVYNYAQLAGLWIEEGGAGSDAATAAAIAEAESNGNSTKIHNTAYPSKPNYSPPKPGASKEYSVGLWQINIYAHTQYTEAEMLDPLQNAAAAVALRNARGNFDDWSTYTSNTYKQYLQSNFTPTIPSGGGTVTPSGALSSGAPPTALPALGLRGYADARQSLGRHLPIQLERSRRTGVATLQLLTRRHKVGK